MNLHSSSEKSSPPAHPATLPPQANWRYILFDQGIVAIFVNFAINWAIAWGIFRNQSEVPLEGRLSIVSDTIATCWMLPLIAGLIVTFLTRAEVRRGRLPGFPDPPGGNDSFRWIRRSIAPRVILGAAVGRAFLAPLATSALTASRFEHLSLTAFLWFKALFACGLGLFFCPFYAWWALHDPVRSNRKCTQPD